MAAIAFVNLELICYCEELSRKSAAWTAVSSSGSAISEKQVWIVAPELIERLTLSSSEIASIARIGCSTIASHLKEKIKRIHKTP